MAILTIICPNCTSKIDFNEGDVITHCPACKTEFVKPSAVKVSAKPEGTVVQVEPLVMNTSIGGGN